MSGKRGIAKFTMVAVFLYFREALPNVWCHLNFIRDPTSQSSEEFACSLMNQSCSSLRAAITAVFQEMVAVINGNESGTVPTKEAMEMMECFGFSNPGLECIVSFMDSWDGSEDGSISIECFVNFWVKYFTDAAENVDVVVEALKQTIGMENGTTTEQGTMEQVNLGMLKIGEKRYGQGEEKKVGYSDDKRDGQGREKRARGNEAVYGPKTEGQMETKKSDWTRKMQRVEKERDRRLIFLNSGGNVTRFFM